jgi:hypothetical protein
MPIPERAFFHGAALFEITESEHFTSMNKVSDIDSPSAYLLNHDTGLYVKHTTEDGGPWRFTFTPDHQDHFRRLFDRYGEKTFAVLVCGRVGICVVNYGILAGCVDLNHTDAEWLEVSRPNGGSFRVRGVKGEYERAIPLNAFPRVLFE